MVPYNEKHSSTFSYKIKTLLNKVIGNVIVQMKQVLPYHQPKLWAK